MRKAIFKIENFTYIVSPDLQFLWSEVVYWKVTNTAKPVLRGNVPRKFRSTSSVFLKGKTRNLPGKFMKLIQYWVKKKCTSDSYGFRVQVIVLPTPGFKNWVASRVTWHLSSVKSFSLKYHPTTLRQTSMRVYYFRFFENNLYVITFP